MTLGSSWQEEGSQKLEEEWRGGSGGVGGMALENNSDCAPGNLEGISNETTQLMFKEASRE